MLLWKLFSRPTDGLADIDCALTMIGFGKFHLIILLTCGLLFMNVFAATMGIGILAPASQCDLDTSVGERGALNGAAFLGTFCSAYFWGYFSDVIGRRSILLWSTGLGALFSVLSTVMPTFESFLLTRFLTGICVAGPASVTLMYLGEFCTHRNRPVVINYMAMFNGVGMIYCPGLAHFITKHTWSYPLYGGLIGTPWRLLVFLFALPGILGTFLLFFLPESPKFLLSSGKRDECYSVLNNIALFNRGKTLHEFEINEIHAIPMRKEFLEKGILYLMWHEAQPIFQKPYVERFLISCLVMFGLSMIANGVGLWFTDMRNRVVLRRPCPLNDTHVCVTMEESLGYNMEVDLMICSESFSSFQDSILLGCTFIVAYNVLGILLLVLTRRQVFMGPLILSSCCGFLLLWVSDLRSIRVVFILFLALPGVLINLLGSTVVDFIPTYLRGKAMCICTIVSRVGIILGANLLAYHLDENCMSIFTFFACVPLVCALLGYFMVL